jgi:hypothetical protein
MSYGYQNSLASSGTHVPSFRACNETNDAQKLWGSSKRYKDIHLGSECNQCSGHSSYQRESCENHIEVSGRAT